MMPTTKEPLPTRNANRISGTASPNGGWFLWEAVRFSRVPGAAEVVTWLNHLASGQPCACWSAVANTKVISALVAHNFETDLVGLSCPMALVRLLVDGCSLLFPK
jgi:hypothetical protein